MRIIDPHCHMISRVTDDYEKMALAGIEAVVEPAFWLGSPRTHVGSFIDYFEMIIGWETQRAKNYGIEHFTCIALNPREANNIPLAKDVLPVVEKYCRRETCVAIGEIGFDRQTPEEESALRFQLRMAKKYDMPVLIHLPHQYKKVGTERTLQIVIEEKMNPDKILLDHNTEETMPLYAGTTFWRGITVYPITKVSVERCANIVQQYGVERLLINSACDWGPSDPLSVPKVVIELKKRGYPADQIEQLVFRNPMEFFRQSERWTFKP
jgi:predicted metal-dependent TIM-barrel fold hydrolase